MATPQSAPPTTVERKSRDQSYRSAAEYLERNDWLHASQCISQREPFKIGFVSPTGKGRLIQLSVSVVGEEPFSPVNGVRRKFTVFQIHSELGGVAGVIAPIIGKQPKDAFVWVLEGEVPGLVRKIGPLEEGGPIVSIEPAGTSYPAASRLKK